MTQTVIDILRTMTAEKNFSPRTVELQLSENGLSVPIDDILRDYVSKVIYRAVPNALKTQSHSERLAECFKHDVGTIEYLEELQEDSSNGKIKLGEEFWELYVFQGMLQDPPFVSLYVDTMLSESNLGISRDELTQEIGEYVTDKDIASALVDWSYAYCYDLINNLGVFDEYESQISNAVEEGAREGGVTWEIRNIITSTLGFTLRRGY